MWDESFDDAGLIDEPDGAAVGDVQRAGSVERDALGEDHGGGGGRDVLAAAEDSRTRNALLSAPDGGNKVAGDVLGIAEGGDANDAQHLREGDVEFAVGGIDRHEIFLRRRGRSKDIPQWYINRKAQ